jgi:hypothetical protein
MNPIEKLADDLGQVIFRLETNFETVQRILPPGPTGVAAQAVTSDLEKLKALKTRLLEGPAKDLVVACELIVAVKHCIMRTPRNLKPYEAHEHGTIQTTNQTKGTVMCGTNHSVARSEMPAARKPVVFGTITKGEWHVDFTLVPKPKRDAAVMAFRGEVKSLKPGFGRTIFVFHHETGMIERRRLARSHTSFFIGETP